MGNMKVMIEALNKTSELDLKKNMRTGFPAGSKKYRRLYTYIDRQCKKE